MPTYQYACTTCHHQLEAVQSFTDDPLTDCPVCEGRLRKVFGAVGVVFKGSGFYRTDSRAAASGNGARGEGSGEQASAEKASAEKGAGEKPAAEKSSGEQPSGAKGSGEKSDKGDKGSSGTKSKPPVGATPSGASS